jgi:cytochrome P450
MSAVVPDHVPAHLVREFNFYTSPGMAAAPGNDPHLALKPLRDGPRVFYALENTRDKQGTWVLTRLDDMREVLNTPEIFSSHRSIFSSAVGETWPLIPLEVDPPDHRLYRRLLNPLLSPQRISAIEASVRQRAINLIEPLRGAGGCEVMSEFAIPYAVSIFLEFLGMPLARMDEFLAWANNILHPPRPEDRTRAAREVIAFLDDLAARRRSQPTDDFVSFVVHSQVEGRGLTDLEVRGMTVLLFIAGLDTVAAAIGFDLSHLARNPADQQWLRADPNRVRNAVEELLRAYSTVQMIRTVTRDVELAGVQMKKGDLVVCASQIGNRDPDEFADPDRVNLSRNANRHMAFAYGVHRCLGSHLARRELVASLQEWLARIPPFRVKEGTAPVAHGGFVFGVESLHVTWQ